MIRVLATGLSGQLAQSLSERARLRPDIELLRFGRPDLDLEIRGSAHAVITQIRPDVVINTAAYTAVDKAEDDSERAFTINVDGAAEVASAAASIGAPVIQLSTDYVFDGTASHAYDEEAPVHPLGVYGRSKLAGERAVADANPRHAIVRTAWVYSPFGQNFVKSIMGAAEVRDGLTVVADQRGSPTSALDLADGLLAMVNNDHGWGETYHLAGRGIASWHDFASEIMRNCAHLGRRHVPVQPISTEEWPTRAQRPRNSVLNCEKFRKTFGFSMPDWRDSTAIVVRRLSS